MQYTDLQKHPLGGVLKKTYSENMQQIYRRTSMLKSDFKLPSNFIKITFRHGCSSVILPHVFKTPFPKNTSRWLLLYQASISRLNLCKVFQSNYILTYRTQCWGILKAQHCDLINYKHHLSIRYFYLTTKLHCLKINLNRWNTPLF